MKLLLAVVAATSLLFSRPGFSVDGDVVNYAARQPIAGVRIVLEPYPPWIPGPVSTVSDAAGHFHFTVERAGRYQLVAFAPRFLRSEQPVMLANGASTPSVSVFLYPEAAIMGKVEDQDGWPVFNANVQVGTFNVGGASDRCSMSASARTNELGEYRIGNLGAGRFYVCVNPGPLSQWDNHYVQVYYPGVVSAESAKTIDVSGGQEIRNINFKLIPIDGVRVRGHAPPPAAAPPANDHWQPGTLTIRSTESGGTYSRTLPIYTADGAFEIYPVPAGGYVITAEYRVRAGPKFVSQQALQVGKQNIDDLSLTPAPLAPLNLAGTISYEDSARRASFEFMVRLRDLQGNAFDAMPAQDGSFLFQGLMPGNYRVELLAVYPPSAVPTFRPDVPYPKSIHLGKNEIPKSGVYLDAQETGVLQINVSGARAHLDGVVLDSAGDPAAGAVVYLETPISWHGTLYAITDRAGAFHMSFVPTGEYRVFAFTALTGALSYVDFLRPSNEQSIAITIFEGANSIKLALPASK